MAAAALTNSSSRTNSRCLEKTAPSTWPSRARRGPAGRRRQPIWHVWKWTAIFECSQDYNNAFMPMPRRTFLVSGVSALAWAAPPSDQIALGVIGSGSRGTAVMGVFQKDPTLKVTAICDVYEPNLENAVSVASKVAGTRPKVYRNYKELLADKEVHAVLIATPEHWHYQMVLDALAAGKDVYIEKPLCQAPEQGIALMETERQTKQIIQVGMQRRSYDLYQDGRAIVARGTLGTVRMVRSWWLNNYLNGAPAM